MKRTLRRLRDTRFSHFIKWAIALQIAFLSPTLVIAQAPSKKFEIVESIPLETDLDNPAVRNTLPVWMEMINGAKKSLFIEQMYFSNEPGKSLEKVVQAIYDAAARGVEVKIIVAEKFYDVYPKTLDVLAKKDGIYLRRIDISRLKGAGIQHSKFFIVDGREVFIGSQNFDWRAIDHIHEIGVRIRHGGMARALSKIFEIDWQLCRAKDLDVARKIAKGYRYPKYFCIREKGKEPIRFQLVCAPKDLSPDRKLWTLKKLLYGIRKARREIDIELLKYSPVDEEKKYWPEIDIALRKAAARGVKVRMIVSDWCKSYPAVNYVKSLANVPGIEIEFSTIPCHSSGHIPYARVTHAKFMTIDHRWSWVGCSNWEKGYYYNSRDVGVIVYHRKFNALLKDIFDKDWDSDYTYPVEQEVKYDPPQIGGK